MIRWRSAAGRVARLSAAAWALLLVSACAGLPGASTAPVAAMPPEGPVAGAPAGEPRWWIVRVRMGAPGAGTVKWHLDALIADRVFGPIVDREGAALVLWRFHRRAAPDEVGHQLRFLFHADGAIAARVAAAVRGSALLDALRRAGEVREVLVPGPGDSAGETVAAVSDPAWPETVRRSWPHFAMGASRNWLSMIREERRQRDITADTPLPELLAHYEDINRSVDALWRVHARHAWLHHLNALFGYQPVLIQEQRLMRF